MNALDAVVEIFTWAGFILGAVLAGIALIAYLLDGTWVPVRAVVERVDGATLVRWFDEEGEVNEATLSDAQEQHVGVKDMADIFSRRGWRNRMRLTPSSPVAKSIGWFAAGFVGLGVAALLASWVILFTRG